MLEFACDDSFRESIMPDTVLSLRLCGVLRFLVDCLLVMRFDDLTAQRMIIFMMNIPHSGKTAWMTTVRAL